MNSRYRAIAFSLALLAAVSACDSDESESAIDCTEEELYDPLLDICVPRFLDSGDAGTQDTGPSDDVGGDASADAGADASPPQDIRDDDVRSEDTGGPGEDTGGVDPACDQDGDGALAESCGGFDCDDNDPRRAPGFNEFCDEIDNNCSGQVNEFLECSFYAHSGNAIYRVDPFEKTAERVESTFAGQGGDQNAGLLDLDTHSSGTLFGVSYSGLYRFDEWTREWLYVGPFGVDIGGPFGLAIDSSDVAYVISEDEVFTVDLYTGQAELLGNMLGDFYASGDCVVNKRDTLYMTSKHVEGEDYLVSLSKQTGQGTQVGPIGYDDVFGLTSGWGKLFGLTRGGDLIEIDFGTGRGSLLHSFDVEWFGAASTPER